MKPMTSRVYRGVAPSNIAFVKYWGKKDAVQQVPANDSLSMTLSNAKTITTLTFQDQKTAEDLLFFEDQPVSFQSSFGSKVKIHLDRLRQEFKDHRKVVIKTHNTFPTSCGIASSASGMAALTTAWLGGITQSQSIEELNKNGISLNHIAHWARLGSGSGCRSVFDGYVKWSVSEDQGVVTQEVKQIGTKNDLHLSDIIVICSKDEKPVSSTEAHKRTWSSPLFETRVKGMHEKIQLVEQFIKEKNVTFLGMLLEQEALEMHSVVMTGVPPLSFLTKETLEVTAWLRQERRKKNLKGFFTIDAGPNPHIICLKEDEEKILYELKNRFPALPLFKDETGLHGVSLS